MKVSQDTINSSEDRTEVLREEEATSIKPVPEGMEIHLSTITQLSTTKTQPSLSTKIDIIIIFAFFLEIFLKNLKIIHRWSQKRSLLDFVE